MCTVTRTLEIAAVRKTVLVIPAECLVFMPTCHP